MGSVITTDQFDQYCWHDNHVYGFRFEVDSGEGGWRSDLVLDIDHILEWLCALPAKGPCQFRVAAATLTFHDVSDLKIAIDWGQSGYQCALHGVSIHAIERERVNPQPICTDPYYRWRIQLNWPPGEIVFGASGFTQVLRSEPLLLDQQSLPSGARP